MRNQVLYEQLLAFLQAFGAQRVELNSKRTKSAHIIKCGDTHAYTHIIHIYTKLLVQHHDSENLANKSMSKPLADGRTDRLTDECMSSELSQLCDCVFVCRKRELYGLSTCQQTDRRNNNQPMAYFCKNFCILLLTVNTFKYICICMRPSHVMID